MMPADKRASGWGFSLSTKAEEGLAWYLERWDRKAENYEMQYCTPLNIVVAPGQTGRDAAKGYDPEYPCTGEEFLARLDKIHFENNIIRGTNEKTKSP